MRLFVLCGLASIAVPVIAQPPAAPAVASTTDPQRLAVARVVMGKLFPPGTYRKLMDGTLSQLMGGMTQQMMNLPVAQLAGLGGASQADLAKLGSTTTRQIMEILDPAFEQRMSITTRTMFEQMTELLVGFEPQVREAYAEAYANRLTVAQLTDLDRFLRTPSGQAYAANAIPAFMDPAVMRHMQSLLPTIIKAMPEITRKVEAATASLPKPKKPDQLSDAERDRLAQLLGVDSAKLRQAQDKDKTP